MNEMILDDFVWSFSRLNSFHICKLQFKYQYIDCLQGEGNFFSEYGTFLHDLLEKYARGEIESYELSSLYEDGYNNAIQHSAPPNKYVDLNQSYFNAGKEYVDNFIGFDEFEIVGVEDVLLFDIGNIKMKGYYDLLCRNKDGKLIIIDHKSSDPKSANTKKAQEYWRQMYLYSIPVKERFGEYPSELHINAFRKQQWFSIPFDIKSVEEVKKWVCDTVKSIKKERRWLPKSDSFFCNFLCNFRNICPYKPQKY